MTHLNKKYEPLTADYKELRRVVIKMRSHMSGLYAPPYWPDGPCDD
jgi:hypothetical protein